MTTSRVPGVSGFVSASTVDEALSHLYELGSVTTVLAGGTDVMVQIQTGDIRPETLLHVGHLTDLRAVSIGPTSVSLGSLVTHRMVSADDKLAEWLPALAEACSTVGGWQTQEVGTVGGNVCNASPAADTIAPLLVADAYVYLASKTEQRSMPLADFVIGRRTTAARPDELVTHFEVTPCGPGTGEVYIKVAPRTAMEVAVVGLAIRLSMSDGIVTAARIAATAVAPFPVRVNGAEEVLVGSRLEQAEVAEAARLVAEAARPIDDARATASYRRMVLLRLVGRAVEAVHRRAMKG
jgi:carbon-monoxide dehydrogenase medium subunit